MTNAASTGRLTEHIEEVWSRYGREEAYFSILVNPKYLSDRLSRQDVEEFYGTGELEVDHLGAVLRRNLIMPALAWRVLELGCGVGRMAEAFARRYLDYVGVDISPHHMSIAVQRMQSRSIDNTGDLPPCGPAFETGVRQMETDDEEEPVHRGPDHRRSA